MMFGGAGRCIDSARTPLARSGPGLKLFRPRLRTTAWLHKLTSSDQSFSIGLVVNHTGQRVIFAEWRVFHFSVWVNDVTGVSMRSIQCTYSKC